MKAKLTFKKKDPWSGFSIYENCQHAIGPYIMRSGARYTGLNKDTATRERLEEELGLDLKSNSKYWDTFAVFLGERDIVLDTSIPEDELKYIFLKGHKRVAFGLNDRKASTDYVLLQHEEEAKEANVKARLIRRAISEFDKLSLNEMRKALRLFGYNSASTNSEVVENTLFTLVEENPSKFLSIWVDNKSKDTQFLIEEACGKGVLRKTGTVYKYGSDIVGHTLEQAIDYLENPANQDLKGVLLSQIEGKEISYGSERPKSDSSTSQFEKLKKEIEKEESVEEKIEKTKTKK